MTIATNISISSKLPGLGTSIFSVMTALANEHGAINLSQGFPDLVVSPELIELVNKNMRGGHNQYAPMQGVPALRSTIAEKIESLYGQQYNPDDEITVTAGGTQAIFTAITALIKEDDEVIVIEPAYDCYIPAIKLVGGIPISVELQAPDYSIPWEEIKRKISFKTRMIIINSPHNPTSSVISDEDIEQLRIITENTNILILSDEVYEHVIFDDLEHHSILKYPDLYERSMVVFSFGKIFHNTGWKVGYVVAPQTITKEIRKVHQYNVFSVNTPVQMALGEFLQNEQNYNELNTLFQQKRDFFLEQIESSRFKPLACSGSYFQLLDYSDISEEADIDFAKTMTIEHGVAAIPTSVFYSRQQEAKVLRFCFAKSDETLKKAAKKLCQI